MMKRCWLICVLLLAPLGGQAEESVIRIAGEGEPYRISMVLWRGITEAEKGFLAYFEENAIAAEVTILNADKNKDALLGFVRRIQRERPDLVYTFGTTVTVSIVGKEGEANAADHVTDVPVVFNIVADPVGAGLISSLASSRRNLTGTSHSVPVATQVKAIQTINEYGVVGALYNPLEPNSALAVAELEEELGKAGVTVVKGPVPVVDDKPQLSAVPAVIDELAAQGVELIYLPSDSFLISNAETVVAAIHARGIPTFSATESPIRNAGALIGIVSNYFTVGKFAGFKARQILVQGKSPADIPVETLARYTFLVDLSSMNQLAHYPPVPVLQFAETTQ